MATKTTPHRGYKVLSVHGTCCVRIRVRVGKAVACYTVASRPEAREVYWSKDGGDIHRVRIDDHQCLRVVAPGEFKPCLGGWKCKHKVLTAILVTAGHLDAGF